jgi:arsenite methyltransferase
MAELTDIRESVRERYAAAARQAGTSAGCCGSAVGCSDEFGSALYGAEAGEAPPEAVAASLGCGVPTAVADLHPGETVLDLGSGAGADVLISARRVAPGGRVIGLDMTDEMLALARANAAAAGVENVEFVQGYLEEIPLPDASVDVVISNCVINLSADKPAVFAEIARVLRPRGRLGMSDLVADDQADPITLSEAAASVGAITGVLRQSAYCAELEEAGLVAVAVTATGEVAAGVFSAIIQASRP